MSTGKKRYVLYDEMISVIMKYFNVSQSAAIFIYHRKRRGFPFKKKGDPKFLEWTLRLQNALVKADECIGWDWEELRFGDEEKTLAQHEIFLDKQSDKKVFQNNPNSEEDDGWTTVKNDKKIKHYQTKTLQILGLVPRPRK